MKIGRHNLFFAAAAVLLILWWAFDMRLPDSPAESRDRSLSDLTFSDLGNRSFSIHRGYRGYVVVYGTAIECSVCMRRLGYLKRLSEVYEDIGFFAILRGSEGQDFFEQTLMEYELPGVYLIDGNEVLGRQFQLSTRPLLLFFDREQRLFATLPVDVEQENLLKILHRYLQEM